MMCLGWYNRPTCKTRGQVQIQAPTAAAGACPNISWFWIAAAALGIAAIGKTGN